jgi:hypothetical protein
MFNYYKVNVTFTRKKALICVYTANKNSLETITDKDKQ